MARLARLSIPGMPHLLIQSGHNRERIFRDRRDVELFRALLAQASLGHQVAIHAYALHDAEIRLLLTPHAADSMSRMMQVLGRRYGSAFNRRYERAGSLWQGRFRAAVIDPEHHLFVAMRWLERGDVAFDTPPIEGALRSSLAHHHGQCLDALITDHPHFWTLGNTPFEREMAYRQMASEPLPLDTEAQLMGAVRGGWPVGSAAFVTGLAQMTGRRLVALPRGRPRSK